MTTIIGVVGAGVLLLCFAVSQFKLLSVDSLPYDIGNFIGALLLTYYAYLIGSMPLLVIEAVWALVSLRSLLHHWKK